MKKIMKFCCAVTLVVMAAMPVQAQWSTSPKVNTELLTHVYWNVEVQPTSDGGFFLLGVGPDNNLNLVTPVLYYFDKDGINAWNDSIKFKTDSTLTWTKVMSHLYVDKDDNAIVIHEMLCDGNIPRGQEKYVAWKVDKAGKQLWGEDGVDLHNGECPDDQFVAAIRVTQLESGNYIFCWMGDQTVLQNVSADGKCQWDSGKRIETGAYPHVVDAGDGDVMIVYELSGLNVRRIDFEGNTIWDVKAFSGQLNPQIPSWTYVQVVPIEDPQGRGVLIGYYGFIGDDEFHPYISYVKADGTHAFPDADAGLRVNYSDHWGMAPSLAYDKDNKVIYAIFQEREVGSQFVQRIVTQKISEEGELLWGNEGKELIPLKERTTGYQSVAMGPNGTVMFGFMENIGVGIAANDPIAIKAAYMKPNGDFVWEDKVKFVCSYESTKYNLELLPYSEEQWIFVWEDNRNIAGMDGSMFAQNLYRDGSMGPDAPEIDPTATEKLKVAESALRVTPNPVRENTYIRYMAQQDEDVRIDLIASNGMMVPVYEGRMSAGENTINWTRPASVAPGLYVLQLTSGNNTASVKIVLQ